MSILSKSAFRILALLLALSPATLAAQGGAARTRIDNVEIRGAKRFNAQQVRGWLHIRRNDLFSLEMMKERCERLLQHYSDHGYYFAQIDSLQSHLKRDSTQVDLVLFITEGELTELAELHISGIDTSDADLLRELRLQEGRTFYEEDLQTDLERILAHYERSGYPYCQVEIERIEMKTPTAGEAPALRVRLQVTPGPKVKIDEIDITGNDQTKDRVILREIGVRTGELYNQQEVDKIPFRLSKLGYFRWVNPPRLMMKRNGKAKLLIELAEGNNNRFDGVVGYNPETVASKGFITGRLDLGFGNLFGTGRKIDAHWERKSAETQDFRFGYTEPWVAGIPLSVSGRFEQVIQDTSYIQRRVGLQARYSLSEKFSILADLSRRSISPDSLAVVHTGLPRSTSTNVGLGIRFSTLGNQLNPRRGVRYETSVEWGVKNVEQASSGDEAEAAKGLSQKRIVFDFENYFPLFSRQVLALGLHGREYTSAEAVVPISELYRLGGARSLRGYREEQFTGSRIAWVNLEYRYLLGPFSRFFAFLDVGHFFREEMMNGFIREIRRTKFGYGLGVRIDTKLGFFGIDYGLGEGDTLSNGKVHIGLINAF